MNVSSDDKILATLCERVFEEVLPDCELLEQPEVDGEELELVAVVGFSGDDARGVLGLSAPSELLEQLQPLGCGRRGQHGRALQAGRRGRRRLHPVRGLRECRL